jgi:hypothetical protein
VIKFEPRDIWVGVYWDWDEPYGLDDDDTEFYGVIRDLHIYICIIPCFPIHLVWRTSRDAIG